MIIDIMARNHVARFEDVCNYIIDEAKTALALSGEYLTQFRNDPEIVGTALNAKMGATLGALINFKAGLPNPPLRGQVKSLKELRELRDSRSANNKA